MAKKPIVLEQMVLLGGLETHLNTPNKISAKKVLRFFDDVTEILKKLDPAISYEGPLHVDRQKDLFWYMGFPSRLLGIAKHLEVRDYCPDCMRALDLVRSNIIIYRRSPAKFSTQQQILRDNNNYRELLALPNIKIISTKPQYTPQDLITELEKLPYVGISDKFDGYPFDPVQLAREMKRRVLYVQ